MTSFTTKLWPLVLFLSFIGGPSISQSMSSIPVSSLKKIDIVLSILVTKNDVNLKLNWACNQFVTHTN